MGATGGIAAGRPVPARALVDVWAVDVTGFAIEPAPDATCSTRNGFWAHAESASWQLDVDAAALLERIVAAISIWVGGS